MSKPAIVKLPNIGTLVVQPYEVTTKPPAEIAGSKRQWLIVFTPSVPFLVEGHAMQSAALYEIADQIEASVLKLRSLGDQLASGGR